MSKEPKIIKKKPTIFTFFGMLGLNLMSSFLLFSSTLIASLSMIFLYGKQGIAVTAVKAILAAVSIFLKIFPIQKMLREIRQMQGEEGDGEKKPVPLSLVAYLGLDVSGLIYIYYILESPEFFLTVIGGWIILAVFGTLMAYRAAVNFYLHQEDEEEEEPEEDPFKYGRR